MRDLQGGNPGILQTDGLEAGGIKRIRRKNLLRLLRADQQKGNPKEPSPCNFDAEERRALEDIAHVLQPAIAFRVPARWREHPPWKMPSLHNQINGPARHHDHF